MTFTTFIGLVSIFFMGMLAGIEFIIHYGVRGAVDKLDDHGQLQLRKALVLRLRVLVPAFFLPAIILGGILTYFSNTMPTLTLHCIGIASLLVWMAIRVVGTVPINSATLDWQLNNPPEDWKEKVNRAERFHIVGVWASIVAYACFMIAMTLHFH